MKKIKIIYHSGVGNTKLISDILFEKLKETADIELIDIFQNNTVNFTEADFLIFGFPTYHCEPSKSIKLFMSKIKKYKKPVQAYIFITCGLYSANTLRIFAKMCISLNIIPTVSRTYRTSAADGILLFSGIQFMQSYEKNITEKISLDVKLILEKLRDNDIILRLPRFKLYSIFNYPNKILGKNFKRQIYLLTDKCIKCNLCIKNCSYKCFTQNSSLYPEFDIKNCENCYRCIHKCPQKALSLYKNKPVKKQLTDEYFKNLKNEI